MKKAFLLFGFLVALNFSIKSQNSFEVSIEANLCLDVFTAHFTNDTSVQLELGCGGESGYSFSIGTRQVSFLTINGRDCVQGVTTEARVNDGKEADVSSANGGKKWTILVHLAADNN